jgi:Ca2+:H+ antiporter
MTQGLGTCIVTASLSTNRPLNFNRAFTDVLSSLTTITAVCLILPTALYSNFSLSKSADITSTILSFSRGSSVVLLALYVLFLYFQLGTHKKLFTGESENTEDNDSSDDPITSYASNTGTGAPGHGPPARTNTNPLIGSTITNQNAEDDDDSANASPFSAPFVLLASTTAIILCTHLFLDNLDDTARETHLTKRFVAAVLVPIASNAPEFMTIMANAAIGRIDYAVSVIVGSILQISLLVIPLLVLLGWLLEQPMTLYFETFQTVVLFFAVLIVNRLLKHEEYTYLHGLMFAVL